MQANRDLFPSPRGERESGKRVEETVAGEHIEEAFLYWHDNHGCQQVLALRGEESRVTIGRSSDCDVAIIWDEKVSRTHAWLERVAGGWTVVDDGLSRNGTFVNGTRILGRQRLVDRDQVDIGRSRLSYREPAADASDATSPLSDRQAPNLAPMQRKVLIALCRPLADSRAATPATNRDIAAEVCLSVDGVKSHLRVLCERFGIGRLPQNEKRARLAQAALAAGVVSPRDF